eukprot:2756958-Rhodomonas_salina.1
MGCDSCVLEDPLPHLGGITSQAEKEKLERDVGGWGSDTEWGCSLKEIYCPIADNPDETFEQVHTPCSSTRFACVLFWSGWVRAEGVGVRESSCGERKDQSAGLGKDGADGDEEEGGRARRR